jgi:hypothetical protein
MFSRDENSLHNFAVMSRYIYSIKQFIAKIALRLTGATAKLFACITQMNKVTVKM